MAIFSLGEEKGAAPVSGFMETGAVPFSGRAKGTVPFSQRREKGTAPFAAICLLLLLAGTGLAAEPAAPAPKPVVNFREPARTYNTVPLGQWTVMVEQQLQADEPDLAKQALARLESKLGVMMAALPASARARLQKLPIYLMYGPKAAGGGHDNGAEYFQRNAPEHYKHLDPRWKSCVVIYCAKNYVQQSELWSLKLLVHEFAHAHHLEQWPEKQPDILQAWNHAVESGLYSQVKDEKAKLFNPGYATKNQLEYFAELSCMYFAGCNYPPANREELKTYDPVGYNMVEKMWGVRESAPAAAEAKGAAAGHI